MPDDAAKPSAEDLPSVDFSTFVLSLSTTVLVQLGVAPDPVSGENAEIDLVAARQTIEVLEMLQAKTLGNLEDEEQKLLESLLYELRMRYVEASK